MHTIGARPQVSKFVAGPVTVFTRSTREQAHRTAGFPGVEAPETRSRHGPGDYHSPSHGAVGVRQAVSALATSPTVLFDRAPRRWFNDAKPTAPHYEVQRERGGRHFHLLLRLRYNSMGVGLRQCVGSTRIIRVPLVRQRRACFCVALAVVCANRSH